MLERFFKSNVGQIPFGSLMEQNLIALSFFGVAASKLKSGFRSIHYSEVVVTHPK